MLEHRGWLAHTSLVDLYAGSGALGIEALSRGARAVVFVESSATVLRTLRDNLVASGCRGRAEVIATSADRALRTLERQGRRVDGVIADPPYGRGFVQRPSSTPSTRRRRSGPAWWRSHGGATAERP
jgi:16S rRNA (guanine(966)-N(2))-methyltransferase RsmD